MTDVDARAILSTLPQRISDALQPWAERSPNHAALVEAGQVLTYGQLAERVRDTQTLLIDTGVRPGDRVMLVAENCRAFVVLLLAVASLDAWPVLVNARLSAQELDQIRDHCRARRLIYTIGISAHAAKHAKRHGAETQQLADLGPIAIGPLDEAVEPEPVDEDPANRVAALIYTSGTTGLPKGVMLTHRNVLFIAAISGRVRSLTPDDRLYGVLPLSHVVGLSVVLLGTLQSGATLYLASRFNPAEMIRALQEYGITIMLGVPAMFALLVEYARSNGLETLRFPALRIVSSSGAPLDLSLKLAVEDLLGLVLHNNYGVTECSPTITQATINEHRNDTSAGRALQGVEIRLIGPDGKPVPEGEVGELRARGPNVMKGYYRAPEDTAAAIDAEGWFNTRDLARLEDGNLFIVGRTKELIVRFGFNVYPAEVEGVLNTHPEVVRSAVIGRSVERNEEVLAFVQLQPNSTVTTADLAKFAAQRLVSYKQPSHIYVVPSMPLTPTGKVIKDELAKMVAGGAATPA